MTSQTSFAFKRHDFYHFLPCSSFTLLRIDFNP